MATMGEGERTTIERHADYLFERMSTPSACVPWTLADEETRREFAQNLATIAAAFPLTPRESTFWGLTLDQMRAKATQITKRSKRRAGARALVNKYGAEAASEIVARKTGRRINFQ